VADAPGRVNLIGEHTDYHEGFVLPAVIPQRTRVTLTPRSDSVVHARSDAVPRSDAVLEYTIGGEAPGRGWLDYVQGVTSILARHDLPVGGFDLHIESSIPIGAGVSSSAALEVSLLRALRIMFHLPIDDLRLAQLARQSETDFVGAPVGVMDQMASSLGRDGEALFIDTRTRHSIRVPIPPAIGLIVIDSGIAHAHAGGEYRRRRDESFKAAELLGVATLRDIDVTAMARVDALPPLLARRARHVVSENARVLAAVEALRAVDTAALAALFAASHASMRDDYEITTPAIDALVSIGLAHPDVYGARMTGGGFGGSVVMLARAGTTKEAASFVCHDYAVATGNEGRVLVPVL
jgi:galactokinase